jgi:hypothetical protein
MFSYFLKIIRKYLLIRQIKIAQKEIKSGKGVEGNLEEIIKKAPNC